MDATYYHLLLNELPLVGVVAGIIILATGMILKNTAVKRTALSTFIVSSLIAIPSYLTGIRAKEAMQVSEHADQASIIIHQQVAYEFILMTALLGLLSVITIVIDFRENQKASRILYIATLAGALFMFFLTQSIGNTGRQISHPEMRGK